MSPACPRRPRRPFLRSSSGARPLGTGRSSRTVPGRCRSGLLRGAAAVAQGSRAGGPPRRPRGPVGRQLAPVDPRRPRDPGGRRDQRPPRHGHARDGDRGAPGARGPRLGDRPRREDGRAPREDPRVAPGRARRRRPRPRGRGGDDARRARRGGPRRAVLRRARRARAPRRRRDDHLHVGHHRAAEGRRPDAEQLLPPARGAAARARDRRHGRLPVDPPAVAHLRADGRVRGPDARRAARLHRPAPLPPGPRRESRRRSCRRSRASGRRCTTPSRRRSRRAAQPRSAALRRGVRRL